MGEQLRMQRQRIYFRRVSHPNVEGVNFREHGGGQVKQFSLDFQGKKKLVIPLAATGRTMTPENQLSTQHFSVCIRNMYDEDRGTGFSDLGIQIHDQESNDGIVGWVKKGLQGLTDLLS